MEAMPGMFMPPMSCAMTGEDSMTRTQPSAMRVLIIPFPACLRDAIGVLLYPIGVYKHDQVNLETFLSPVAYRSPGARHRTHGGRGSLLHRHPHPDAGDQGRAQTGGRAGAEGPCGALRRARHQERQCKRPD